MYLSHEHIWYNNPYRQEAYYHSTPFLSENFYHEDLYDSQYDQWFPSQGGPMGPPPGLPGSQPSIAPPGQGPEAGPPTAPPPSYVPTQSQQAGAFAVDPGSIRGCLFRYTYVWLRNRQQFWYYPTFVGRTSVSGYRWNGFMWVYFGVSLRQIQSFTCV